MKKQMGLWIDHQQAIIVTSIDETAEIKRVLFDEPKQSHHSGNSEDIRNHRFEEQLNRYYNEVISHLDDATAILILGSDEAQGELQKRLENLRRSDRTVAIKSTDSLTDEQIVAEVRQQFREVQHIINLTPQQKRLAKNTNRIGTVAAQFPSRKQVWSPYKSGITKRKPPYSGLQ